jgi:hypothetical protein
LIATCSPAVSSTGSDPTVTVVIAAELLLAEALAEAVPAALLELLLELLQAVASRAATPRVAAVTDARLTRVNFMDNSFITGMAGTALAA